MTRRRPRPADCSASQWKSAALRVRDRRDLGKRMHDADLIVRRHRADEQGVRADCATQPIEIDSPFAIHLEIRHTTSVALQCAARIENGAVLRGDRDDVTAAAGRARRRSFDGEIIRFRRAAREDEVAEPRDDDPPCSSLLLDSFVASSN